MPNNKLRIAEFNIEIAEHPFKTLGRESEKFFAEFEKPDFTCSVSDAEIDYENEQSEQDFSHRRGYLHFIAVNRKLAEWMPMQDTFLLHSAVFDVDGTGVAFAAHSGTGKTTHMLLWQKLLGDRMTVVNGDKPFVRFFEEEPNTPYAYGSPWNGKEHLGCNMRTPLRHICFIERSETNYVEPIKPSEAIDRIFNQVYMPRDPAARIKTVTLIDRLLHSCQLWKIHCNMEPAAAETAYRAIFAEEQK